MQHNHFMITYRPPAGEYFSEDFNKLLDICEEYGNVWGSEEDSQKKDRYDHCHIVCDNAFNTGVYSETTFRRDYLNPKLIADGFDFTGERKCSIVLSWGKKKGESLYGAYAYCIKDYVQLCVYDNASKSVTGDIPLNYSAEIILEESSWIEIRTLAGEFNRASKKEKLLSPLRWGELSMEYITDSECEGFHKQMKNNSFNIRPDIFFELFERMCGNDYLTNSNYDVLVRHVYQQILKKKRHLPMRTEDVSAVRADNQDPPV